MSKEESNHYVVQIYNFDECHWSDIITLPSKEKAEAWMKRAEKNIGGVWRIKI